MDESTGAGVTSATVVLPLELTVCDHCGRSTWFAVDRLPATLGRSDGADVHLKDPWISHRHCEFDRLGDMLLVRDLGSKNGIFLHGHRVQEAHLKPGDHLTIGRTEIVVKYRRAEQAAVEEAAPQQPPKPDSPTRPVETIEILY